MTSFPKASNTLTNPSPANTTSFPLATYASTSAQNVHSAPVLDSYPMATTGKRKNVESPTAGGGGKKFVVEGSKKSFILTEEADAVYIRLDLPGVTPENLEIRIRENENKTRFHFIGKEEDTHPFFEKTIDKRRVYSGCIPLPSAMYERGKDLVKNVIKHGVLRVKIPKLTGDDDLFPVYDDLY